MAEGALAVDNRRMVRPRKPLNEQYVIKLYEAGHSLPAIASELGVDRSRVTRVVKEAGIFHDQRGAHWLRKRQSAPVQDEN